MGSNKMAMYIHKTLDEVQPLRKPYMYYIWVSKQDESHSCFSL